MAHAPVFASKEFQGKSVGGRYSDTIEELDWSVGQIIKTLRRLKLEKNTMVIVTSDNGPCSAITLEQRFLWEVKSTFGLKEVNGSLPSSTGRPDQASHHRRHRV